MHLKGHGPPREVGWIEGWSFLKTENTPRQAPVHTQLTNTNPRTAIHSMCSMGRRRQMGHQAHG
jgi:hypothetical protein